MPIDNRPISPHLDIYRWRITMLSSIIHRASGAFISLGLAVLVLKLVIVVINGKENFSHSGILMNIFWVIWSLAIYYHLCNGIRHLVWDSGHGFEIKTSERSAIAVILSSFILTIITWSIAFLWR